MASITAVITDSLNPFSIELSAVRLERLLVDADLDGSTVYTKDKAQAVKGVLVTVVSDLLAMPDVTEGGYSVKWDRTAVSIYLSQLRAELGITPVATNGTPTVSDRSYLW